MNERSMRATSNATWLAVAQLSRVLTQLASITVLTRFLSPRDYGIMAMASVVVTLCTMLRDMGTAAAVIQTDDLSEELKSTVFWFNLGLSSMIAVLLSAGSSLMALAFKAEELAPILVALAPTFPVAGSAAVHQALLERAGGFQTIARIEVISSVAGLICAIGAAWRGAGVYSLVVQALVTSAFGALALWIASGWRPRVRPRVSEARTLLRFSGHLTAYNFVNYLARNADNFIIGRWLGAVELGNYAMAYKLMLFPLQNVTFVAFRALLPVMSRQQGQLEDMALLYLQSVRIIASVTAPITLGMFVLRVPVVEFLFGAEWRHAADLLLWLAPAGLLQSVMSTTGVVLMARGRTDVMFRLGVLGTLMQGTAFVLGARVNVDTVAAYYFGATVLLFPVALAVTMRQLDGSFLRVLRATAPALLSALCMAAVTAVTASALTATRLAQASQLGLNLVCAFLSYACVLALLDRDSVRELAALLRKRARATSVAE